MTAADTGVSPAQRRFAALLEIGMRGGLALLALGFVAYVAGLLPATLPPETLPQYWSLPVADYRRAAGVPDGWGWLSYYRAGELLPLAGIVVLCGTALLGFVGLLRAAVARRDWPYVAIAALEIAILLFAASGFSATH
jgi:hypothetical protein